MSVGDALRFSKIYPNCPLPIAYCASFQVYASSTGTNGYIKLPESNTKSAIKCDPACGAVPNDRVVSVNGISVCGREYNRNRDSLVALPVNIKKLLEVVMLPLIPYPEMGILDPLNSIPVFPAMLSPTGRSGYDVIVAVTFVTIDPLRLYQS